MIEQTNEDGVREIHLETSDVLPEGEVASKEGDYLGDEYINALVQEDADVYKPNGEPLVKFRKGVFPEEDCQKAYEGLKGAASSSQNRGAAAGPVDLDEFSDRVKERMIDQSKNRIIYETEDGNIQNSSKTVYSGIAGYFDKTARLPYCRTTAYTRDNMEKFEGALPFIRQVSDWFRKLIPERWKIQKQVSEQTTEDFLIDGTVFTTITVNKNFRTGLHKDAGDLKDGFGNLTVLEKGDYDGGHTMFPQYGVGVDCREGDFLGMDVHEWHCNTEMTNQTEDWERISLVCYYRKDMVRCGSKDREKRKKESHETEDEDYNILDDIQS
jgi:hypothetical protein